MSEVAVVNPGLQQFRQYVTGWIELDNGIKKLQLALKEKREVKNKVAARIMEFMMQHDVEDVNIRDVRLRYKVVQAKTSLTQKQIKERLMERLPDAQKHVDEAFHSQGVIDRPTLRRLKVKALSMDVS